jgi:ABC-type Mn2+/Zn2+ transport system ATPase subunit
MAQVPNQIICSMVRVSKYYNKRPVLEDISLSYFYGAKIGVLGLNGAGKSSRCCASWPARIATSTAR